MRLSSRLLLAFLLCGFLTISGETSAQTRGENKSGNENSVDSQSSAKSKLEKSKSSTKKITGRLPRMFGKLKLSEQQRTMIYQIQANYREEVTDLQKRVLLLKAAERKEIEEILTRSQKTLLEELQSPKKDQASESESAQLEKPVSAETLEFFRILWNRNRTTSDIQIQGLTWPLLQ
jgi:hypothetical protein